MHLLVMFTWGEGSKGGARGGCMCNIKPVHSQMLQRTYTYVLKLAICKFYVYLTYTVVTVRILDFNVVTFAM